MAKILQLRSKFKPSKSQLKLFYSTNSNPNANPEPPPPEPDPEPTPKPKPFSFSSIASNPSKHDTTLDAIRKNLQQYRDRSVPSFQDLYNKRNLNPTPSPPPSFNFNFDGLRQNLRSINNNSNPNRRKPFDSLPISLDRDPVIGGTRKLPDSIFGKEMARDPDAARAGTRMGFVRFYSHEDLGKKLALLRPAQKKAWFSLRELNERLAKLRENEEKEGPANIAGVGVFSTLKESLVNITRANEEKSKKTMIQRLDVLSQIGGTPSFMLHPPKEQLVEKYFHPDNMSSEEKMKLELQKVRDEFKMSESDCGSSRVQVAQLTTKIKHLSKVLHKKDKHSRKGLQAMVQKRKKLLKYLRRTDWDSYCLVLSKLGLRDNPDYKF